MKIDAVIRRTLLLLTLLPSLAWGQQHPIDFKTLRGFASFAASSYLPEKNIAASDWAQHSGYTLTRYASIPDIQIAYFIATNDITRSQIIAVRGTSNVENAFVDINLKLVDDSKTGIRLHSGFAQAAKAVYSDALPLLKKGYTIDTTGHSLGGAVALILAMYLESDGYKIGRVVTFGQPKVTNVSGSNRFAHLPLTRVVTPRDMVPLVPPLDPMDINKLDIYWHSGEEILLYEDDRYSVLEGISSMLRATQFTQQMPDEQNLQHHQMDRYIALLDRKMEHARRVPFNNSLNLFNLFGTQ